MNYKIKLGIISSKGGHLTQIIQIKKVFGRYKKFWVTFKGKDVDFYLKKEKKYFAYYPESRNIINFVRNIIFAFIVLRQEKPTHLISSGAGLAVPFFIVGKFFFRTKLIFIEPYDFIAYPSLSGKMLYNMADLFLVQHKIQKKWFPKAKYWGSLL
jgi:beta-1,4-N-acetylglucosaminyltransferase